MVPREAVQNVSLARMAGRHLSSDELSLVSFYSSKGVVAASYDRPIIFGVTAFLLWRGAATYRMPFYQPQFIRFAHPYATSLPRLYGLAWHGARISTYGALGYAAYILVSERFENYMIQSFRREGLQFEVGLKKLLDDMDANTARRDLDEKRKRA